MRTVRNVTVLLLGLTAVVGASIVSAQQAGVPTFLLGGFVDDYGITYAVSEEQWRQGTGSRYDVVEWNVAGRYFIARNHPDNPGEGGLWTRVDWVQLDSSSGFTWAYCYAVYDATTADRARSAPPSARERPRTGCNGHPFSRMRREATAFR